MGLDVTHGLTGLLAVLAEAALPASDPEFIIRYIYNLIIE